MYVVFIDYAIASQDDITISNIVVQPIFV